MQSTGIETQAPIVIEEFPEQRGRSMSRENEDFRLSRWLVSFASGRGWYAVGEYVARDAEAAIDRAIEVFGSASNAGDATMRAGMARKLKLIAVPTHPSTPPC